MKSWHRQALGALVFLIVMGVLAVRLGAVADVPVDWMIELRFPRVILAASVGAALAVVGCVLQAVFVNPLCEPYTLGISSGAALGTVIGAATGILGSWAGISFSSLLGSLVFSSAIYGITHRRGASNFTVLLGGVALGLLGSSLVFLVAALSMDQGVQGALFWLLGDLSRARMQTAWTIFGVCFVLILVIWSRWKGLDAFLAGEEGARSLGVDFEKERRFVLFLASLLISVAVSSSGMIGFLGLVVPHVSRRWVGALHLGLIPVSALVGAGSLIAADLLARVVGGSSELPVGVVTALVGAPAFLFILLKNGVRS